MTPRRARKSPAARTQLVALVLALVSGVVFVVSRTTPDASPLAPTANGLATATSAGTPAPVALESTPAPAASERVAAAAPDPRTAAPLAPAVPSGTVRGVVRWWGDAARPVVGARVRCSPAMGRVLDVTTDEHGRFEASELSPGNVRVQATIDQGDAESILAWLSDSGAGVELSIEMMSTRRLRVVASGAGTTDPDAPPRPFALALLDVPVEPGRALTDAVRSHDAVTIRSADDPKCPPDRREWTVEVHDVRPLYVALELDGCVVDLAPVVAGDEILLSADATRLAAVLGALDVDVVEAADGAALVGALVTVRSTSDRKRFRIAEVDTRGRVAFEDVIAGAYEIDVGDGQASFARSSVEVAAGSRARATVRVEAGRVVSGTIEGRRDDDSRAIVRLRSLDEHVPVLDAPDLGANGSRVVEAGPPVGVTRTTTMGRRFVFVDVSPGRYVLETGNDALGWKRAEVDVTRASARDVVLRAVK